ncbi:MAG: glycosyltransferase family 87 protein [Actinomycetota bacterium]
MADRAPSRGLALVLVATFITLALGWALRAPCLGSWADGRQYNRLCYSDIAALYGSGDRDRGLSEDRVPYLDGENEYPVLTGLSMWVAALPATSYPTFFNWTALLMAAAALATAAVLHRLGGPRALLFALAPTLAIYAFVNWDLLAVALATGATLAYLRRWDTGAGVLLGLGAAAKLYPALLVVPFALGRLRDGSRAGAARLLGWAAGTWAIVNLPFALLGFERWSEFFRFNAARPADWDSLWFIASRQLGFVWDMEVVNALAAAVFLAAAAGLWIRYGRRLAPGDVWRFAFPLLVAFLLTSKVFSPQYGLWLLPWFALVLPDLRLFVAFQLADVAVFVTRFQFFARLEGIGEGLPQWSFELAVLARAVVLVLCVTAWTRQISERDEPERIPALAGAA